MNDIYVLFDWFLEWVKNATRIRKNYPHRTITGWAMSPNVGVTAFGTPCIIGQRIHSVICQLTVRTNWIHRINIAIALWISLVCRNIGRYQTKEFFGQAVTLKSHTFCAVLSQITIKSAARSHTSDLGAFRLRSPLTAVTVLGVECVLVSMLVMSNHDS